MCIKKQYDDLDIQKDILEKNDFFQEMLDKDKTNIFYRYSTKSIICFSKEMCKKIEIVRVSCLTNITKRKRTYWTGRDGYLLFMPSNGDIIKYIENMVREEKVILDMLEIEKILHFKYEVGNEEVMYSFNVFLLEACKFLEIGKKE